MQTCEGSRPCALTSNLFKVLDSHVVVYQLAYALHIVAGGNLFSTLRGKLAVLYHIIQTIRQTILPRTTHQVFPHPRCIVVILPSKSHHAHAHNQLYEIDSLHNTNLTKFNRHHCSTVTSSSWVPLLLKGALGYT